MPITQLDTENADLNLTSSIVVLTDTPDASNDMLCQGYIVLGDGTKNLDGSGGMFELIVTIGGVTVQPTPQIVGFNTDVRAAVWTTAFPVPTNNEVILKIKSPNGADTDVDTTSYLYDIADKEVDVIKISGDSTAADNLELQYDTTGLFGDTFPSTQVQVGNLTSGSAAINTVAESFTKSGAEPETNTYASTAQQDGVLHIVEDIIATGVTDVYYQFDVGGNGVPVSATWEGYVNGQTDTYLVRAYNWDGTAWETIKTLVAVNSTTIRTETFIFTTSHVGTGANIGKVRLKFYSTDGSTVATDRLTCAYSVVFQSVGYADGAVWVDTTLSNTNTTSFVDGVADNPVSTIAAAKIIADNVGLSLFRIAPGSTITLATSYDNYEFVGYGYTVILGDQSMSGTIFDGAIISGDDDGSNVIETHFYNCAMGNNTLGLFHMENSRLSGDLIIGEAGTYILDSCYSSVAGTGTPSIDFGSGIGNTNLNLRHYSGGIEIKNIGETGTDNMSLEGHGQLVINSNCDPSNSPVIAIRGHFTITDNVSGGFVTGGGTISDAARYDTENLLEGTIEETYTLRDVQKVMFSVLAGISSGGGTPTTIMKDSSGTTDRVTATTTSVGNRTNIVIDTS